MKTTSLFSRASTGPRALSHLASKLKLVALGATLLCAVGAPAQSTTTITTTTNAPARLTVTDTTVLDIADGVLYTFDHLATGTNSAVHLATAGAVFRTTGGGTTVFISNTTTGGRGAAMSIRASGTLDLQNVRFGDHDNPALGNFNNNYGGALYASGAGAVIDLANGEFYYNAATSGGAFAVETGASSTVIGGVFHGNTATTLGGAILYNSTALQTLTSATFGVQGDPSRGNTAANRGGALVVYAAGTVAMTDVAFFGNKTTTATANQGGGAIHITAAGRATITGAVFEQNTSISGGALQTFSTDTTIITSATFGNASDASRGNTATTGGGGAIYQSGGHLILNQTAFYANSSTGGGGGAIYLASAGTLSITGAVFVSNSVGPTNARHGSAISLATDAIATITSATFSGNYAAGHATILINNNTVLKTYTLSDVLFSENYVGSEGGAVFIGNNTDITFNNARFTGNSANAGGALMTRTAPRVTLNDALFTSNTARTGLGGAINIRDGGLLDYNATVSATHSGNLAGTSGASGGFLYLASGGTANFNIASSATVQIGGVSADHDTLSTGTFTNTVINKTGDGTLILADGDSSSQRGAINVAAGRFLLANSATLGGNITVASGAVFGGQGAIDSAADGDLNRAVSIQTGGTLQIGSDGAFGDTQHLINTGSITLANNTSIIGSGQIINDTGSIIIGSAAGDAINIVANRIGADDQWIHITGNIAGNATIVKTGEGILGISGNNTYTGGIQLEAGALRLGSDSAIGTGTLNVTGTGASIVVLGQNIANNIVLNQTAAFSTTADSTLSGTLFGPGGFIYENSSSTINITGTFFGVPSVTINSGNLSGDLASVPLVSISNTARYTGNLARAANQTLSIGLGGAEIAGDLSLANNASLTFDLANAGADALLHATGAFTITGTTALDIAHLGNGTYKIISASSIGATAANIAYTVDGGSLTGRHSLAFVFSATDISVNASYRNLRVTYAGTGNTIWDDSAANWTDASTSNTGETRFNNGDSVRFANATGTLTIAAAGITAGDIEVNGSGALTFAGSTLATSATAASVDGVTGIVALDTSSAVPTTAVATGKLTKLGTGTLTLQNTANNFADGIDLNAGVLAFSTAQQLGSNMGPSASPLLLAGGTLRPQATATLANTITISATSALDTGAAVNLTHTGTLLGATTLDKLGAGTLTIAGDAAAFTGVVNVGQGAFLLANSATLSASVTATSSNATVGGAGLFLGNLTLTNATLQVGAGINAPAPGTLSFAASSTLTLTGATRLAFAITTAGADTLFLANPAALVTDNNANIISLAFGAISTGTYTLANAPALANIHNLEINGTPFDSTLRIRAELAASGTSLLFIYDTDASRYMQWTGASGTSIWNIGLANFTGYNGDTGNKFKFQNGDTIRIATTAAQTITIEAPVTVTDLVVDNTGTLTLAGAALTADASSQYGTLITNPTGALTKTGHGTLILNNAANTFLGGITLNAGVTAFSTAQQLGTGAGPSAAGLLLNGGTLRPAASVTLTNNITLSAPSALDIPQAVSLTLTGSTSGAGTLNKLGAGALILSGTAPLGHASTTIYDGLVVLRDIPAAAAPGVTHTFQLDGGILDLSAAAGFTGTGANAGTNDWQNLTLTGSAGAIIGSNDKITLRTGDTFLAIGGDTSASQGLYVVIDAAGGVATLTTANTYAGITLLQSGTLRVAANDRLGNTAYNRELRFTGTGATLEITADAFSTSRPITLVENGAISIDTGTATINSPITGAGKTLTKLGPGTLVITSTTSSATLAYALDAGVLQATPAVLGARSVTVAADATLALEVVTTATYTPAFAGGGVFEKRGPATLALASAFGHTGPIRVASGALKTTANNQFNSASPLAIAPGAALDLRGTSQTAHSLTLDGALLFSATVNSNLGVILASDRLDLAGTLAGSGTINLTLAETTDDGSSPIHGPAPSSIALITSAENTSGFTYNITNGLADAIYGWQIVPDGQNLNLAQKRLVPVIPAVAGINAALQIAAQSSLNTLQNRLDNLRLLNDGHRRPGSDWFVSASYRDDTVTAPLYNDAKGITRTLAAGVNLTPAKARSARTQSSLSYGIYTDFTETQLRLTDAETNTKTYSIATSFAWQPNSAFHAEAILRGAQTRHAVQVKDVDELRIGGTGLGGAFILGYTIQTKSGWFVDLRERLSAHITSIEKRVTDSAHRVYDIDDITSIRAGADVQFSRHALLFRKWPFRPSLRLAYDYEIKGSGDVTVLRYHDAGRTRLRDRHTVTDDLSGGALAAGLGAAIRFNDHLEASANLSAAFTGPLQDYTMNLALGLRW